MSPVRCDGTNTLPYSGIDAGVNVLAWKLSVCVVNPWTDRVK